MDTAAYDPTNVRERDKAKADRESVAALRTVIRGENIRWLMEDAQGRDIVFWLLEASGLFTEPFDPNGLKLAHNAGKAWLGREIHNAVLKVAPELFVKMMQEHKTDGGVTVDAARGRN